jgi:RNA polymerase sigma factor (sigma-70 family)
MELWTVYPKMVDENIEITETVLRERPRLMNFIRQRVGDRMDAEDILQEVLSSLVETFRLPTAIEHVSAWLYQVARNRIIDRFRRRKEERLEETGGEDGERSIRLDLELPASDGDPEADYARAAILQALQTALEELPDNQREVFIAHELEGKSFKHLVVETGISMNTLLSRKRYAVIYLRSRLAAAYDEFDI